MRLRTKISSLSQKIHYIIWNWSDSYKTVKFGKEIRNIRSGSAWKIDRQAKKWHKNVTFDSSISCIYFYFFISSTCWLVDGICRL